MATAEEFTMERDEDVPEPLLIAAKAYKRELRAGVYANVMQNDTVIAIVKLTKTMENKLASDHELCALAYRWHPVQLAPHPDGRKQLPLPSSLVYYTGYQVEKTTWDMRSKRAPRKNTVSINK